jgi:ribosome-associated protein
LTDRNETKAGSKRGAVVGGGAKKTRAASARPLIHSSHGQRGKSAARVADDGGDLGEAPPRPLTPRKAAPRLKVSKAKDGAPRAPRPTKQDGPPQPRLKKAKAPQAPSDSLASDAARELAVAIAIAALDKKAVGLEVLDVAGKVDYADFLVLMTGRSDRQVQALAQGIEDALRQKGKRPLSVEGLPHASWVLMDFGDVVVHVFQDDARSSYDLDGLWMDARRIPLPVPEELR